MGDTEVDDWTYEDQRAMLDRLSDHVGEYQGIPVPIDDMTIRLAPGHPLAELYAPPPVDVQVIVGGPNDLTSDDPVQEAIARGFEETERVVNEWYDGRHNRVVVIFQKPDGRAFAVKVPYAPDRSMDRLTLALSTLGASDAWSMDSEANAIDKLQSHVTERQLRHYLLTGSFLETSKRSDLTYVFRRLRPTVVLTPRWPWYRPQRESMRVLAVLCMHPIGYYDRTWAGCMVPTDDVIAHLLLMRGDEAGFWRQANQHDPASPEAGL